MEPTPSQYQAGVGTFSSDQAREEFPLAARMADEWAGSSRRRLSISQDPPAPARAHSSPRTICRHNPLCIHPTRRPCLRVRTRAPYVESAAHWITRGNNES